LIACDGSRWKTNRRLAWTSLFTNEKIRGCFADVIEGECGALTDYLDQCCAQGTVLDLTNVFPRFTLRVISKLIFGRPLGVYEAREDNWNDGKADDEVLEWVEFIFEYMSQKHVLERMIKPLRRLPWAKWHRFLATVKKLRGKLADLVEESEIQLLNGASKYELLPFASLAF
jgi:cytochrome P450